MKLNLVHKIFIVLVILCFIVFYSCVQKKHQEAIYFPPLPEMTPGLANPEVCNQQNHELKEIRRLLSKRKFKAALKIAGTIVESPCSVGNYLTSVELIGDVFKARKEHINAFYFYEEVLKYDISDSKTQTLIKKMVEATSHMRTQKIVSLTPRTNKPNISGLFLFQSGLAKIEAGKEADAIFLLNEFVEKFSQHKDREHAQSLIKQIKEKNDFKKTKIGVLLPLSGYYKIIGHGVLEALKLALKEFNDTHKSKEFYFCVEDTAADSSKAVKAVKKLEKEKVSCIIGPMVNVGSAAAESNKRGIPMIIMSQKSGVTQAGKYVLRNFMTPAMQIRAGISYFVEEYGFTRFSILYPNEKYGISFKDSFSDIVSHYNAKLVSMVSFEPSQTDFFHQINQFIKGYQKIDENGEYVDMNDDETKEKNRIYRAKIDFDVLFIPDTAAKISMIAPQLKYHGIDVALMGTNLWNSKKLLKTKDYVQAAVFPDGFYLGSESKRVTSFVSSYFEVTGNFPGYTESIAYDTAMMFMDALSSPRVRSRQDVITYLQSNMFKKGVTCPTSFDMTGEPVKFLELFQVVGDDIKLIRSCNN
ncbi:penicillin-binding protein activator [Desulfobacula phenolica]|uniref:ABC-type branched-chain amino acid transport system, substrate-binding protein n=1 Tax=Desulfobacula phenolica TaxID=90732 RepID=A0A1H2ERN5_9BACT|nr:penicillin-binding protein activator [Desulfobacula phenolica]SDT97699.1 ABC-type branched-chain amino acid transport system, substrate-binding protein [Desulfobacula phenolica]